MLLADRQQTLRIDEDTLRVISRALNNYLVPKRNDAGWKMIQLAAEAHRLLDALARAVKVSHKPQHKREVGPASDAGVLSKLVYYLAVAFSTVTVDRQLELPSRLGQVSAVGGSQSDQSVGNGGLGNAALRFRLSKKKLGNISTGAGLSTEYAPNKLAI